MLIALVWLGLPHLGVEATGMAFAVASAAFLAIHLSVGYSAFGIRLERSTIALLLAFAAAGLITFAAARHSPALQLVTGGSLTVGLGLVGLRLIACKVDGSGRIATHIRDVFARAGWPLPPSLSTLKG